MKNNFNKLLVLLFLISGFISCKTSDDAETDTPSNAKTPVTVTRVSIEPISESIELRATSSFQKKVPVKANAIGYIDNVEVAIGDEVTAGQLLFTIKTKEATALENFKALKDSSLNFSGLIKINAQKSGVITTLDHQKGDYVQDGDELGIISERNSLVFVLEVPFELHSFVKINGDCEIVLPDNQVIKGKITGAFPSVDAVSQTQIFIVKPISDMKLPENLITKVRILKSTKDNARVLPKSALSADETQTKFWIMKVINDSISVKVEVKKGIETGDKVEIIEPKFSSTDRIVLTGNYGLSDTAKITIQKGE